MKLILTEKPDVTKMVKKSLASNAKYVTPFKGVRSGFYENSEFVICNSIGHIVELMAPQDIDSRNKWSLNSLPYQYPDSIPTQISKDKKAVFKVIQHCFKLHDYDEIIIATDGDREGQNIWRKIKLHLKNYKPKKESRMWISEWTTDGVKKAYNGRFDNKLKYNLGKAAQLREEMDYRWGMEGTVAVTCKYSSGKGNVASIGRVMTAVQYLIKERELNIVNFKSEPYTAISVVLDVNKSKLKLLRSGDRITGNDAKVLLDNLKQIKKTQVTKDVSIDIQKSPNLFDGTSIMQEINKKYGFSAKKTNEIIQRLYQVYTLTTYPGTNDTKISESSAKIVYDTFINLQSIFPNEIKKIVDNSWKIKQHHITSDDLPHEAITPVYGKSSSSIDDLSGDEKKVYLTICKRFLAAFYPNAEYENTSVSASLANEKFQANGKMLKVEGWTEILEPSMSQLLPLVNSGIDYPICDVEAKNKHTAPLSRYNEATLIEEMKNAGKFVEDKSMKKALKKVEGIGTARTRAAIIENIKRRGYILVEKQVIYPTDKCMTLFDVLPKNTPVCSPAMTAEFESVFDEIESGNASFEKCRGEMTGQLLEFIETIKKGNASSNISNKNTKEDNSKNIKQALGLDCPYCGKPIIKKSVKNNTLVVYSCDDLSCGFGIFETVAHKKLTKTQIKQLVQKGKTDVIKGLKSREGKEFEANLVLKDKKISFDFN